MEGREDGNGSRDTGCTSQVREEKGERGPAPEPREVQGLFAQGRAP